MEVTCDCSELTWKPPTIDSVPVIKMQRAAAATSLAVSESFGVPTANRDAPFVVVICYTKLETYCDETGKFSKVKWQTETISTGETSTGTDILPSWISFTSSGTLDHQTI